MEVIVHPLNNLSGYYTVYSVDLLTCFVYFRSFFLTVRLYDAQVSYAELDQTVTYSLAH